jgi:hypothetical protein
MDCHAAPSVPISSAQRSEAGGQTVAIQIEIVLIAGVVAIGLMALGRAILTGLAMSRRPPHHLAQQTGTSPVPPDAQIPPSNHG